jgi:mannose-6-phosphate isomerase-like protein (cupin superfamily)
MMKAGKVWGNTRGLFAGNNVEIHRIEVGAGGVCSKHKHDHKSNMFYVESGTLEVRVWKNDYALVDKTMLFAGDTTTVPPGEFHQFCALTEVVAYEVYWVELDPGDIVRENVGGQETIAAGA